MEITLALLLLSSSTQKRLLRPPVTYLHRGCSCTKRFCKFFWLDWRRSSEKWLLLCRFSRQALKKIALGHLSPIFIAAKRFCKFIVLGWRRSSENDSCPATALSKHSKWLLRPPVTYPHRGRGCTKRFCKLFVMDWRDPPKMTLALSLLSPSTQNDCLDHLSPIFISDMWSQLVSPFGTGSCWDWTW